MKKTVRSIAILIKIWIKTWIFNLANVCKFYVIKVRLVLYEMIALNGRSVILESQHSSQTIQVTLPFRSMIFLILDEI